MSLVKEQVNNVFDTLKDAFGYKNPLQAPRIQKVVINVGTGKRAKTDKKWNELVAGSLAKITGQKSAARGAKQSIAGFKIREGDTVGQIVTLRGPRMHSFLDKLVHIALPRTRDFRGLNRSSVDSMGNMTLGIKEHTIFPETSDEELKNVFGMSITVTTTAGSKEEATKLFEHVGFPLKKEEESK